MGELQSGLMKWIVECSTNATSLPSATSFALDASLVERPSNLGERHAVDFDLAPHVVDDILFIPIRLEGTTRIDIPPEDGLCELLVGLLELVHAHLRSLGDETSLHLRQGRHDGEEEPPHGRTRIDGFSLEIHDVESQASVSQLIDGFKGVMSQSEHSVEFEDDYVVIFASHQHSSQFSANWSDP